MPIFQPTCSVVLCTRYRSEFLGVCLQAASCLDYPDFELVVVDNSPGDPATREVAEQHKARYVVERRKGLSRARNRGRAAANGEIVAFLDDDALPEGGWLSALAAAFEDPQVMAAAGRTLERIASGNGHGPASQDEYCDMLGTEPFVLDRDTSCWFQRANFGGVGNGNNMAFRRTAWEVWPGFDERLGLGADIEGGEEHYSFFSLIDRGYSVAYTPEAVIRHPLCPRPAEQVRKRFLQDCVSAGAYMAFLLFEEPRYRGEVLQFVREWLTGAERDWQNGWESHQHVTSRVAPAWRVFLARCYGPLVYLRSRLSHKSAREAGVAGLPQGSMAANTSAPAVATPTRSYGRR